MKYKLPVDGYYKRKESIITKGEDKIELTTNIDVSMMKISTHQLLTSQNAFDYAAKGDFISVYQCLT